jgi:hypothetical protein
VAGKYHNLKYMENKLILKLFLLPSAYAEIVDSFNSDLRVFNCRSTKRHEKKNYQSLTKTKS